MKRNLLAVSLALIVGTGIFIASNPMSAQELNGGRIDQSARAKGKGKQRPPSGPTPHWPDGRVNLGPAPGQKGVWEGNAGATLATNPPGDRKSTRLNSSHSQQSRMPSSA